MPIISKSPKFIRRSDLTTDTRLYIAFTALMVIKNRMWGKITELSREFMISRTFVYMLATQLDEMSTECFYDSCLKSPAGEQSDFIDYILSMRMEGHCSIESISCMMKRFEIDHASTGFISQYLNQIGSLLPNTLKTDDGKIRFAVFASDEIFSKQTPILVTVDPVSSAILRIELCDTRKAEDWKKHWECIEDNGIYATYLVCDQGSGLSKAHKEHLSRVFKQTDTYHAIAHQLGQWVSRFENSAYKAIEKEYEIWNKLDSAKSEKVIDKRISAYEDACKRSEKKIELSENFQYLYCALIEELDVFDKNGILKNRTQSEENIMEGLKLMDTLGCSVISKGVKSVEKILPDLLNYYDVAESIVNNLKCEIEADALQALCLGWQWRKKQIKSKTSKYRNYSKENEDFCLDIAKGYLQNEIDTVQKIVYSELDRIIQSSSMVECINSIIRPYLDTSKNQINQEMLNLIMFYHNHRRYKNGKRKDKTPMEILTGEKQEKDWIELLRDITSNKENISQIITVEI